MPSFFNFQELLPRVGTIDIPSFKDDRGSLTKYFNSDFFLSNGIKFSPKESFLSKSSLGVLRGMHFQTGPAAHDKLVCCLKGRVLDVIVDIRPESAHFNQPVSVELSESSSYAIFVGIGYAHGFLSLDDDAWLLYYTSTVHESSLDKGVLWSSINYDWPMQNPILSARDLLHPGILEL